MMYIIMELGDLSSSAAHERPSEMKLGVSEPAQSAAPDHLMGYWWGKLRWM